MVYARYGSAALGKNRVIKSSDNKIHFVNILNLIQERCGRVMRWAQATVQLHKDHSGVIYLGRRCFVPQLTVVPSKIPVRKSPGFFRGDIILFKSSSSLVWHKSFSYLPTCRFFQRPFHRWLF